MVKFILAKELIYACELWSIVACMCTRAMQVRSVRAFAHVELRLMDSLEVESLSHATDVYQNERIREMGQLLECVREQGNSNDPYTIAVLHW